MGGLFFCSHTRLLTETRMTKGHERPKDTRAEGADVLLAKILVHAAGGTTTIAHGEDDGSATTDDVTTSEDVTNGALHGLFAYDDGAATRDLEALESRWDDRVGRNTNDWNRRTTTRSIGLSQFHYLEDSLLDAAVFVGDIFDRIVEHVEIDALLHSVMHLFGTGWKLVDATTIDERNGFGTHTLGGTSRVHGCVATATNDYVLALEHRSVIALATTCTHKVDASQVFVGRHHADEVLTRDVHKARKTCTRTYEDAIEAHLVNLVVRNGLADNHIGHEVDTHIAERIDLGFDHAVGQTELWDTILEYTTDVVECLEDGNLVAELCHIGSESKAGWTGTNGTNLLAILWSTLGSLHLARFALIVGSKTLEITDGNGLLLHLDLDAHAFALLFLWADTTTNCRKAAGLLDGLDGLVEVFAFDVLDECWNIDAYGTAFHTAWIGTIEATLCFEHSLLAAKTLLNFFGEGRNTIFGSQFGHLDALDGSTILWRH